MNRNTWLGGSLALVNLLLYGYLISHLNWSGPIVFAVSALFLVTSSFYLTWNLGYAYAIHRRSNHPNGQVLDSSSIALSSVAIVVPAYREGLGVMESMLKAFLQLDYPAEKLRLYLCDDTEDAGERMAAKRLCEKLGGGRIEYSAREHRRGFKAGAINDILPRITGEYCIMLDVDHVPQPDMVRRLVSAKIGSKADFLMFPQYFSNQDENSIASASSLKQLVDYRIERVGRCTTNSGFCVTTNWITRVETLKRLGGLDESTVTEDLATGLIAHSKGFRIDILDDKLAQGLAPNSLDAWRKQQYRWSSGTFDVARNIFPRVWKRLSWHQRLDYSLCISWYLSGFFSFVLYLFPIFTALGLRFFRYGSATQFLTFTLSLITISWVLTNLPAYLESKSLRKTILAYASSLGVSDVYVRAIISTFKGKRRSFSVTKKGKPGHLSMGTALRVLKFHMFFLAIGVTAALYSLTLERSLDAIANVGWLWYNNFWIILSALVLGKKWS